MVLRRLAAFAAASLAAFLVLTNPRPTAGSPGGADGPGGTPGLSGRTPALALLRAGVTEIRATPRPDGASPRRRVTEDRAAPRPRITEIRIDKSEHTLELVAGDEVLRTYRVAIGPGGEGPKRYEGDRRTPVGTYRVAGRIKGLFHQFLLVSYPNEEDRQRFAALKRRGEVPPGRGIGHSIGIHGVGGQQYAGVHKESDWTLGCVALDDDEIDEIARLTPDGTRIVITD